MDIFIVDIYQNLIELNNINEVVKITDRYYFYRYSSEYKDLIFDILDENLYSLEIL